MSNNWDALAKGWESEDTRLYAELAFDSWGRKVVPLVAELVNSRVLDFGCGTGLLTQKLAPLCGSIVAIDTSAGMIEVLQRKVVEDRIDNVIPLVTPLGFGMAPELADPFDLVVASSVCSFLPDYESTLCELSAAIEPGGAFAQWDWLSQMPVDRVRAAFKAAGLIDRCVETVFEMAINGESMAVVLGVGSRP